MIGKVGFLPTYCSAFQACVRVPPLVTISFSGCYSLNLLWQISGAGLIGLNPRQNLKRSRSMTLVARFVPGEGHPAFLPAS